MYIHIYIYTHIITYMYIHIYIIFPPGPGDFGNKYLSQHLSQR